MVEPRRINKKTITVIDVEDSDYQVNSPRVAAGIFGSYKKMLEQLLSEYTHIKRTMHTCQEVKDGSFQYYVEHRKKVNDKINGIQVTP